MEEALRYELEKLVPELKGNIYPTNAPESSTKPYLVYSRINTQKVKTLEGTTSKEGLSYMFNIMANRYSDMKDLTKRVESFLLALPGTIIGSDTPNNTMSTEGIYIEDLNINNIHEVYEHQLKVNRGIIDFTIYY